MKCAHADAGHPCHLFDCISHRRFSAGHHDDARGWRDCQASRNVRVKGFFLFFLAG
jgi:hypothetical protein